MRVRYEDVVARIGEERYNAARRWAWREPADGDEGWPEELWNAADDLSQVWFAADASVDEMIAIAVRGYREIPFYLTAASFDIVEFTRGQQEVVWDAYRSWIESPDERLAEPALYALEVDYFEAARTSGPWWTAMTRRDVGDWRVRLARVLPLGGPVDPELKEATVDDLLDDREWQPAIFEMLMGSAFGYYGNLDPVIARRMLMRMQLSPDTPRLASLWARLEHPEEAWWEQLD